MFIHDAFIFLPISSMLLLRALVMYYCLSIFHSWRLSWFGYYFLKAYIHLLLCLCIIVFNWSKSFWWFFDVFEILICWKFFAIWLFILPLRVFGRIDDFLVMMLMNFFHFITLSFYLSWTIVAYDSYASSRICAFFYWCYDRITFSLPIILISSALALWVIIVRVAIDYGPRHSILGWKMRTSLLVECRRICGRGETVSKGDSPESHLHIADGY